MHNAVQRVTLAVIDKHQEMKEKQIPDTESLERMYPDRFKGIGKFPGKYHIELKEGYKPTIHNPRKYPIHLQDDIKAELQNMCDIDVIEPIPEGQSTDWLNQIAFSRKASGKLRICLDPKDLNLEIRRTYHRAHTVEEIIHRLAGAKVFSKLDAKHGYWSVELDEESSELTAFNSPLGRYRFKRLPFGLKVAQDIFQEKMDKLLSNCPGTINIADDITVYGRNNEEHDKNLHRLMNEARKFGLIFNVNKCKVKADEIDFFGMIYNKDGVRPDPRKSQEIKDLPSPTCVKDVERFLGMVQYMAPFIPKLSEMTTILRDLKRKDVMWNWTPSHQQKFMEIKDHIINAVTLAHFNHKMETKVQVDASQRGLGAALIQTDRNGIERVISFASKALTDTETRYANIEREMLAVVFGCERFHTYLYGSNFTI